jgi:hypothetical protein
MPDRPETEALLELFERMDQRALEHLHRVESPSTREALLHRTSLVPGLVEPIDPAEFQIPGWLPKAVGAEEAEALVQLFEAVRFANDEHVGEPLRELRAARSARGRARRSRSTGRGRGSGRWRTTSGTSAWGGRASGRC